ncbi:zinc ribbon domain-containing protein [Staphylococcus capitis]|uniref:Transposase n=1 Tax=Staphylococcus capitis TaxID=29388 RepID=A0ABX1SSU9_STACP|nr:zinc ribbon domain-containing protein [Staphylococcus capitis]NMK53963.1 transposase [Staphylococcus capitis]NMK69344.1 transposase [Staphylococcus capitis]
MNTNTISVNKLIDFVHNKIHNVDTEKLELSKSTIYKLKKDPLHLWKMKFENINKLNKFVESLDSGNYISKYERWESEAKAKYVEVVGIDLGTRNTLTASDIDAKRVFLLPNKKIYNAIMNIRQIKDKSKLINYYKNDFHLTVEVNVKRLVSGLLSYYKPPVTFVVGEMTEGNLANKIFYELFLSSLQSSTEETNFRVETISEEYTSITCPICEHVNRKNRTSKNSFNCQSCGFSHYIDDVVACMNIVKKYQEK